MENLAAELEAYEDKLKPFMAGAANGEASKPSHNNNIINNSLYKGNDDNYDDNGAFLSLNRRESDLKNIIISLIKGGLSEKETSQLIEYLILSWHDVPDTKWIAETIENAKSSTSRRERNLAQEIRELILSSNGVFLSSDVIKELGLSSRVVIQNASKILNRLCKEKSPLIEPYGNKRGCFRRIENDIQPIDWKSADTTPLNLIWPFGIHNLVKLYPGNIAVIAGAQNAGKTAFIHNFIRFNQQQHRIHLFSSEGGKEELNTRISQQDLDLDQWNFEYYERGSNFADVIRPDEINIIDYLELHDEFYKVGGILKDISDRLKNGFALIALQKNAGRDEGLGGARGLEKPRLYLAMDSGRLKIVKAKAWADRNNNPNGQVVNFNIVDGCKFIIKSRWERSE